LAVEIIGGTKTVYAEELYRQEDSIILPSLIMVLQAAVKWTQGRAISPNVFVQTFDLRMVAA